MSSNLFVNKPDSEVLEFLRSNKTLPDSILVELASSQSLIVQEALSERLDFTACYEARLVALLRWGSSPRSANALVRMIAQRDGGQLSPLSIDYLLCSVHRENVEQAVARTGFLDSANWFIASEIFFARAVQGDNVSFYCDLLASQAGELSMADIDEYIEVSGSFDSPEVNHVAGFLCGSRAGMPREVVRRFLLSDSIQHAISAVFGDESGPSEVLTSSDWEEFVQKWLSSWKRDMKVDRLLTVVALRGGISSESCVQLFNEVGNLEECLLFADSLGSDCSFFAELYEIVVGEPLEPGFPFGWGVKIFVSALNRCAV